MIKDDLDDWRQALIVGAPYLNDVCCFPRGVEEGAVGLDDFRGFDDGDEELFFDKPLPISSWYF